MKISSLFCSMALGAMLLSTAALAEPNVAVETYIEEDYMRLGSLEIDTYDGSDYDGYSAYDYLETDHATAMGRSRADGVLGAIATAGGTGGGGGATAMSSRSTMSGNSKSSESSSLLEARSEGHAIWEDTITNDTGGALNYTFLFHVMGGELAMATGFGNEAAIGVYIDLNGDRAYYSLAHHRYDGYLDLRGDFLTTGYTNAYDSYLFNPFDASIDIGTIAAGDSFTLRYELVAAARARTGEDGLDGSWARSTIGDPFGWDSGEFQFITTTPVPEPETFVLLLAGLGMLGLVARRRRA